MKGNKIPQDNLLKKFIEDVFQHLYTTTTSVERNLTADLARESLPIKGQFKNPNGKRRAQLISPIMRVPIIQVVDHRVVQSLDDLIHDFVVERYCQQIYTTEEFKVAWDFMIKKWGEIYNG